MRHAKRGFRRNLVIVFLIVAIFSVSMLLTNYKDKSGNLDLSKSDFLMKIKEESAKPIETILSVGKGNIGEKLLIDDVVTQDDVYQDPELEDVVSEPEDVYQDSESEHVISEPEDVSIGGSNNNVVITKPDDEDSSTDDTPDPVPKKKKSTPKYKEGDSMTTLVDGEERVYIRSNGAWITQEKLANPYFVSGPFEILTDGMIKNLDIEIKNHETKEETIKSNDVDSDGDGLTDSQEVVFGSDPDNADIDGDGLDDRQELEFGTNPELADSDGDGLSDLDEFTSFSDPLIEDTDMDGVSDGDEVKAGTDPTDVNSIPQKKTTSSAKQKQQSYTKTEKQTAQDYIKKASKIKGAELLTDGGYKLISNGDNTWTRTFPSGKTDVVTTEKMLGFLDHQSCLDGKCMYNRNGETIFGKQVSKKEVEETLAKSFDAKEKAKLKKQQEAKKKQIKVKQETKQPVISAGYGNFDAQGDLIIHINQDDKPVDQYFFRDDGLFSDTILRYDKQEKQKVVCKTCEIVEQKDGWYLIDHSRKDKLGKKFKLDKDPDDEQERILDKCEGKFDTKDCRNAAVLVDKVYDRLNFEFRSRVESVFGTLFEKWTQGWLGSRMEVALQASVCNLQYYRTDDSETEVISGGSVAMPNFVLDYEGEKTRKLFVVDIGGEKEEITPTLYRYAFSIKLIGQMHYIIYLQNSCTGIKSFDAGLKSSTSTSDLFSWKKYFDGEYTTETITNKIEFNGWRDEGIINKPKGTHIVHYSGDDMTFDCEDNENCRFNQACVKIIDDGTIEYETDQTKPYCVDLNNGQGFTTEGDTGYLEC